MREKIILAILVAGVFTISSLVLQNIELRYGLDATAINYYQSNR